MSLQGTLHDGQRIFLYKGDVLTTILTPRSDVSMNIPDGCAFRDCGKLESGDVLVFPSNDNSGRILGTSPIQERTVDGRKITYQTENGSVYSVEFIGIDMDAMLAENRTFGLTSKPDGSYGARPFPKNL